MCCELSWKWHFGYACCGCFIGVSVLFSFFQLNNATAAYWGLVSGIFALFTAIYRWRTRPKTRKQPQADGERALIDPAANGGGGGGMVSEPYDSTTTGGDIEAGTSEEQSGTATSVNTSGVQPAASSGAAASRSAAVISTRDRAWSIVAIGGMVVSGGGFVAYTASSILTGQALTGASDWMSVVWTFMSLKWSFGLFWAVHKHVLAQHAATARRTARASKPAAAAANGAAVPSASN